MSRLSRSARLLQNAEAALISSIEIYNKPSFAYREETFAILAMNAWELLVKAKLLSVSGNQPKCLYVSFAPKTKSGKPSKKLQFKRNRTGNLMTMGIDGCMVAIEKKGTVVPSAVKKNLEALTEIRDNAIHYVNAGPLLAKQVLEIGTAALRNFIGLGKLWLDLDLSPYSLYLMPIGFLPTPAGATGITVSSDERNVVNYLAELMRAPQDETVPDYHVSLNVNISFKRTTAADASAVIISNDPNAVHVTMSEEDIRDRYPWDSGTLRDRVKARYMDFKENKKYHTLRKKLALDPRYMKVRYLDPGNTAGAKKSFYNPNILTQFDKAYTLKSLTLPLS